MTYNNFKKEFNDITYRYNHEDFGGWTTYLISVLYRFSDEGLTHMLQMSPHSWTPDVLAEVRRIISDRAEKILIE